jgi:hypothetical protein
LGTPPARCLGIDVAPPEIEDRIEDRIEDPIEDQRLVPVNADRYHGQARSVAYRSQSLESDFEYKLSARNPSGRGQPDPFLGTTAERDRHRAGRRRSFADLAFERFQPAIQLQAAPRSLSRALQTGWIHPAYSSSSSSS